jgi:SAM-dependent methyltransferase
LPLARGDMAQLPFRSGSVDLIVGVESVYNVPRRGRVFAEFARVLRPGGTLLLSEFLLGDNPRRMYTGLVSAVAQAETLEPEATYRAKLGAAGFDDISLADVGEYTAVATAEHLRVHATLRHDLARAQLGRVRGAVFSTIAFPLGYKLWCRAFEQRRTRHVFITAHRS